MLYSPQELATALKVQLGALSQEQQDMVRKAIEQDIILLEAGEELPTADRYLSYIYQEEATLLSYLGERLLVVCEGVAVRETATESLHQQQEDLKLLRNEGLLPPGIRPFFADFSIIEKVPRGIYA